ncbi:MAG: acyl-CoA/acyl-ACP dehydrogenase [Sulfuricella sp.]|nr:acyl-CoA/acyl-ACP dehydrogenase [Sulfuricella sp.]
MHPETIEKIVGQAREIAATVVAAEAEAVDREAHWPEKSIHALLAAGLGGLMVPREHGGLGQGLFGLARVCEALGKECASTAICFGMHGVGTAVIAAKATPDQVERYLVPIGRGEHLTTLALSEPGSGVHFYLPQCQLRTVSPERFQLDGAKTFVTNGSHADSYVISTVAASGDATPGQMSCVMVPAGAPGIEWGGPWQGFGMRGNDSRQMALHAVPVPRGDLLGQEGDQTWYVFEVVTPNFLMAMAGTYLGVAGAALALATEHLSKRGYSHSGALLGQQPVVQHRLGSLWAELEKTRRLVYYAAEQGDAGGEEALQLLMSAKAEVADCAVKLTNEAMTLMGGIAYRENSKLTRLLREARAAHVMSPTTDLLRLWTGRALLGQPLLVD